jgi:RNA polymerase sigma-70 factor, ECF subfamily
MKIWKKMKMRKSPPECPARLDTACRTQKRLMLMKETGNFRLRDKSSEAVWTKACDGDLMREDFARRHFSTRPTIEQRYASRDKPQAMTEDLLKEPGEDNLIRQICGGQKELFCTLIAPYQRTVYSVAYSVLNNAADAEEVAQEAFLKALKNLTNFRAESKFSTWLIQITLNEARGRLRGNRAHLHYSLNGTSKHEDGDFVPRDLADWREIPSEALARKELRENIEQALRTLRPIYREVLVLRDVEHFSVTETAEALGISKDLVKTRLLRARLKMREALAPGYDGSWTSAAKMFKRVRPW